MTDAGLDELGADLWKNHRIVLPDLLARLTPHQFYALFAPRPGGTGFDRVEALKKHNDARGARGLRPEFPSWL